MMMGPLTQGQCPCGRRKRPEPSIHPGGHREVSSVGGLSPGTPSAGARTSDRWRQQREEQANALWAVVTFREQVCFSESTWTEGAGVQEDSTVPEM